MNLKRFISIFTAAILAFAGICTAAEDAEPITITVAANAENMTDHEGIDIGASGRIKTETPGYATFGFNIETAGYYYIGIYASFGFHGAAANANLSVSIDGGDLITCSKDTLSALSDIGEDGMRTNKMLDTFYFSEGTHEIKFVTECGKNSDKAVFHLAYFTLTKAESIFVSSTGTYGQTTWSSDGWNQISTGELGSGEYSLYISETGTYTFMFNMSCILDNTARAVPYFSIDGGEETEFSYMNMVATGDMTGVGNNLCVYKYVTPVDLTQGTHTFKITTKQGPNDNSTYFFFNGFSINKEGGASSEPEWEKYITVPAIGIYTVENNLRIENGFIATGNLGKVVYKIETPYEAYFDLDFNMGWTITDQNAGANVHMQVDGRKSVLLTADNTEYIKDTDNVAIKNYKYTKQIRLDAGEHLISFETSVGINPYSSYFWFNGFTVTEAEDNGTATEADEEEQEEEDTATFSPDMSIAASEGTESGGFYLENKCHWATNDPGEVEFELNIEKSGLYYMYIDCKTSGRISAQIDDDINISLDSQMKKCRQHCDGRCTYHSRYKYCEPINFDEGTHKIIFAHENGTTYLGGFDFEYIGEFTGNYGMSLENRGIKVGRTTIADFGNKTTGGIYADDGTFTVTYSSDNEETATVSKDGEITAVSVGRAVITAQVAFKNGEKTEFADTIYILPYKKGRLAITNVDYDTATGVLKYTAEAFYDQKNTELALITAVYGKSASGIPTSLKSFDSVAVKGLKAGDTKEIDAGTYADAEIIKLFITDTSGKVSPLFEYRVK